MEGTRLTPSCLVSPILSPSNLPKSNIEDEFSSKAEQNQRIQGEKDKYARTTTKSNSNVKTSTKLGTNTFASKLNSVRNLDEDITCNRLACKASFTSPKTKRKLVRGTRQLELETRHDSNQRYLKNKENLSKANLKSNSKRSSAITCPTKPDNPVSSTTTALDFVKRTFSNETYSVGSNNSSSSRERISTVDIENAEFATMGQNSNILNKSKSKPKSKKLASKALNEPSLSNLNKKLSDENTDLVYQSDPDSNYSKNLKQVMEWADRERNELQELSQRSSTRVQKLASILREIAVGK